MDEREEGGIPFQWKHQIFLCYVQPRHCSTDLRRVKQKKESETIEVILVGVFSGSSLSNFQKMEYKSSFQKLILNPVRFNVWQENKLRIFSQT